MEKTLIKGVVFFGILAVLAILPFLSLVNAAQCSAQSCAASTTVSIVNSAPTVGGVTTTTFTGTGYSNTSYFIQFNATDVDGNGNLNISSAVARISNTSATFTNASNSIDSANCTQTNLTTTISRYNCTVLIPYHFANGVWQVNASICDNSNACGQNSTGANFTINTLDYVNSSNTSITWVSVVVGSTNTVAQNTIMFSNGGNQKYLTLGATAYNTTNGSNVLAANAYSVDDNSGASSETALVANTSADWPDFALDKCPTMCPRTNETDETSFWFVDVGTGNATGTYTSVANWALAISS